MAVGKNENSLAHENTNKMGNTSQEAEIRRMVVQSQPRQIVPKTLS
jgi:hypothetical protein